MSDSLPSVVSILGGPMLACLVTYIFHSSLLLAAGWIITRSYRSASHTLRERIWKFAALAGFITTPLQVFTGLADSRMAMAIPVFQSPDHAHALPATGQIRVPPSAYDGLAGDLTFSGREFATSNRWSSKHSASSNQSATQSGLHNQRMGRFANGFGQTGRDDAGRFESSSEENHGGTGETLAELRENPEFAAGMNYRQLNRSLPTWMTWTMTSTLLITLAGLLRLVGQTCWLKRRLVDCELIADGPIRSDLDRLVTKLSVPRAVELLSSEWLREPVAYGLQRWRIVLPHGIEDRLTREEIQALLAHEMAHLVRGDAYWLWIGRGLCACFPLQPLNFLARREWQRASEFLCDEWAVSHRVPPLTLARCLTTVAEWQIDRPVAGAALAVRGKHSDLGERIERLVADDFSIKSGLRMRTQLLAATIALVFLALLVWRGPYADLNAGEALVSSLGHENQYNDGTLAAFSELETSLGASGLHPPVDSELLREIHLLDEELAGLTEDLSEVRQLLGASPGNSQLPDLAERLHQSVTRLTAKRAQLIEEINQM